jgi:hypothetical protein
MTDVSEYPSLPRTPTIADPQPALAWADRLLREAEPSTAGLWPRTAARLIRVALERAVNRHWSTTRPQMLGCPTTMRLRMLENVLGRGDARDAYLLWTQLSDATHPHPYELAPIASELRRWHDAVSRLVNRLDSVESPCT